MRLMIVAEFLADLSARTSVSGKDLEQIARVGGPRQLRAPRRSANGSPCRDRLVDSLLGFENHEHADPGYYRSRVGRLGHEFMLPAGEESKQKTATPFTAYFND